jgi:CubicO group peptidase (beta-lactamase class C family)
MSRSLQYRAQIVLASILLMPFGGSFAFGQRNTSTVFQKVDAYLQDQTGKGMFRGSVLVGIDGKIVFEKGYGFADEEWSAKNTPTTKFHIASLTKQFTATCILLLQESHQLQVQDPISKYVSNLPPTWQTITLHQLLTHTSGIPNYAEMPKVDQTLNRTGASLRELVDLAATKPLEFQPGTQLHYTNTGYTLLGMVIEKVSGVSYADFLEKNIFVPLGMKDSGYDAQSKILPQRASGYMRQKDQIVNADFIDMTIPNAAGSIYSTVEDMYRWNEAIANGTLLSPASTRAMFETYPETLFQGQHYGYGVVLAERFGKTLYYHGGGVKGFETVLQRYPKERVCIVVLENLDPTRPWDAGDFIAGEIFGQPVPASH